jgi:hypothetical protein
LTKTHQRHMHSGDMGLTLGQIAGRHGRRDLVGIAAQTLHDRVHSIMLADAAQVDGAFNLGHRIMGQALQHADVLPCPARGTVLCFEVLPQLAEDGRQLPTAVNIGVIKRRRLAAQADQVVDGIENLLALAKTARMAGDALAVRDDLDVFDISLDRHLAKGKGTRHAVIVVIEADGLILVHLGRLHDARIEGTLWQ